MYLDLLEVLREPGNTNEKPIDIEPRTIDDIVFSDPIRGVVKAVNARRSIVVSGRASTAIGLQCARCLREFEQPLELELEAAIPIGFVAGILTGASRAESPEDDASELSAEELAALFDGHSLDVNELIRQAAVLQTPRKPLCADDCPGLPEAQEYIGEPGDARWNALKEWNNGTA